MSVLVCVAAVFVPVAIVVPVVIAIIVVGKPTGVISVCLKIWAPQNYVEGQWNWRVPDFEKDRTNIRCFGGRGSYFNSIV